jgi:predicted acetyltransferase
MQIRLAIQADLKSLCQLFDLYRQELGYESDYAACFIFLNQRITENDSIIFVTVDGQGIVGFVQLYPSYSSLMLKTIWTCSDVYVLATYRHQGIANKMLAKAKILAKTADVYFVDNQINQQLTA